MTVDLHTHTVASGHGTTDTVTRLAQAAAEKGIRLLGISDHGPAMTGAASASYFQNLSFASKQRFGVSLLYGIELNILNVQGDIDLEDSILNRLDYAIASLHSPLVKNMGQKDNTLAYIHAMKHPKVRIIGHPDDTGFPIYIKELVLAAKEHHVLLEINNSSLSPHGYRGDASAVDCELLTLCADFRVPVIIGSDSHGHRHIGNDTYARALMQKLSFPDSLIANDHPDLLAACLSIPVQ